MHKKSTYATAPVHFELPIDQRNRLKILRIEGGYQNIGELVIELMDLRDAAKEEQADQEASCRGQS